MMTRVMVSWFWIFSLSSALKVKPGENVTLQCQDPKAAIALVRWTRPDLRSDGDVFFYRDGHEFEKNQHPLFYGRVKLRDPQMKDGDFSVILTNVIINDTGTYECQYIISNTGGTGPVTPPVITINLTVIDPGQNMDEDLGLVVALSGVSVLVFVFLVVVNFMIYIKSKRLKKQIYQPHTDEAADPEDFSHEPEEKMKEEKKLLVET